MLISLVRSVVDNFLPICTAHPLIDRYHEGLPTGSLTKNNMVGFNWVSLWTTFQDGQQQPAHASRASLHGMKCDAMGCSTAARHVLRITSTIPRSHSRDSPCGRDGGGGVRGR
jgi:hypothetical protein